MANLEAGNDGLSKEQFSTSLSLTIIFRLVASIPVIARLVRSKDKRLHLCLDDYLVAVASVIFWAQAIAEIVQTVAGEQSGGDAALANGPIRKYYQSSLANDILYSLAMTLVRWSIASQVLYYSQSPSRTDLTGDTIRKERPAGKFMIFTAMGFNGAWCLFAILIGALQCVPFSSLWEPRVRNQNCLSVSAVVLSTASWDFACSIVIAGIAITPVLNLGAWKSKRLGLLLTLCLGFLTLAAEAARIGTGATITSDNYIYNKALYNFLAPVETSLAILTACTPFMTPSNASPHEPRRTRREQLIALRDRIFIGKDTYNYRYAAYDPLSEEAAFMRPSQAYHPGGAQVHSTPVIMPKSPLDPLPRYGDMRRGDSVTSQHIQMQQEVHVEMENMVGRESGGSEEL